MTEQDTEFWYGLLFGLGTLVLGTIVLVIVLIQGGAFARARVARRETAQERELIARYEELADSSASTQDNVSTELSQIRRRLDDIERMLREVE
jgi:hypothetical protein